MAHIKTMSMEEAEKELARRRQEYGNLAANLLALTELLTYKKLTGEGMPKAQLKGRSAREITPAIDRYGALFMHFNLLDQNLDKADAAFKSIGLIGRDKKLEEIAALLYGDSIEMPPIDVDLAARDLTSPAQLLVKVTPDRVLADMSAAYKEANRLVHIVDGVWKGMRAKLKVARTDIDSLKTLASGLGNINVGELGEADAVLTQLKDAFDSDPLDASDSYDSAVAPKIELARTRLETLKRQKDQASAALATARSVTLPALKDAHEKGKVEFDRRKEKVIRKGTQSLPAPHADSEIKRLETWLGKLEELNKGGQWAKVAANGLPNWNSQVAARTEHARRVFAENHAVVERRYELRGLIDGLRALAGASRLGEDPQVTRLHDRADQLLYTRPTDLDAAELAVKEYQAAVRGK